ncbi:hypothetical protein [Burkholderia thailandensis]|uniref:hypothetical protein n=1 Tax=Burkholderia thailandensis TaxID=57975 RepID=UPI0005154D52|nr:hypothetical protein [Burkholderia thailandensis]AIS96924.1 hypothetical protein BTHA_498 [Burkholderia thailandensis MSMB59]
MSLLDQLPRLSAYDPGAVGEGGLDPLGLGATADRIADVLVPGIRARMSQPRFVTISAVGALAYQTLHELTADQGKTTVDIAFEWLVVEAIVRHPGNGRTEGLPGNQKAARAKAANERLSRRTYLNGPRVFGFTGVYRPFSRNVGVLSSDDFPAENAIRLVNAWERDLQLPGYATGAAGTRGGKLRKDITDACERTLEKGECSPPPNGQLLRDLSDFLAPREAGPQERGVLRALIVTGNHEIRNELAAMLIAQPPSANIGQRDLALQLHKKASPMTRRALSAAIDYENAATALDNTFRRFLAHTTQQHGSVTSSANALQTPGLAELAPKIGNLVKQAIASMSELDEVELGKQAALVLERFAAPFTPHEFLHALIERHEDVQAGKNKLSWLDRINGDWTVRIPYRNQSGDLNDEIWVHPMRLVTLANFLTETA